MSGRDLEIRERLRPEPMTEREQAGQSVLDDLSFNIFSHKMTTAAVECQELLNRLGASTGARWGDSSFAFYTASGDIATCSTGIYFHAFLQQIPAKYVLKHWRDEPSVGIKPGDAFFCNDPLYGGVHTPDMMAFVPIFYQDELIAWAGAVVHSGESGAQDPGGVTPRSANRYEEGLHIPPVKIGENYILREDVLNMFANSVRDPRTLLVDIKARIAACRRGERRLLEVVEERGVDFVIGGLRRMIDTASEAARRRLESLPDCTVRQVVFLDTVGTEDGLLKLSLTLNKHGDRLTMDFADTSPEVPDHSINTFSHTIVGKSSVYLCNYLFPDLPVNSGLLDVLDWEFPPATFINPNPEAPISLAPYTMSAFNLAFSLACAKLIFSERSEHAVAPWFNSFNMPVYGGLNQWGEPVADVFSEINAGGTGGRPHGDGVNVAGSYFATLSDCGEAEMSETYIPVLYPFRSRHLPDSFGHGRHRGGAGMGAAYMVHNVPWLFLGSFGYGSRYPNTLGLFGGYAAPSIPAVRVRRSNLPQLMAEGAPAVPGSIGELLGQQAVEGGYQFSSVNCPGEPSLAGDILLVPTGGGAGYGDVLERDPEAVMQDLREGLTTHWASENVYHVVYDPETLQVDTEATEAAREAARQDRLRRGKPLAEFEAEWSQKSPPEPALRFYGAWPHPSEGPPPGPPGMG
ncbi:MAG: hydantoinase B/oxoprolinase family protein [Anaerolineae bacterium]